MTAAETTRQFGTQPQPQTQERAPAPPNDFERLLQSNLKAEIRYKPFGAEDEIRLSLPLIRNYIAVPATDKQSGKQLLPDDRECTKFLMLCRSRRLNPYEGDAFMVPYFDTRAGKHVWSLITAHAAFLKRAELHPEYDGMESGIIVQDAQDVINYREGDFTFEGDRVLGGWSCVHFKSRKYPMKRRVNLSTYKKGFGVWLTDPAGMICKVAEAQALRDSFPSLLGGMYLREEGSNGIPEDTTPERRRPEMTGPGAPPPEPVKTNKPAKAAYRPRQDKPEKATPQEQEAAARWNKRLAAQEPQEPAGDSPAVETPPEGQSPQEGQEAPQGDAAESTVPAPDFGQDEAGPAEDTGGEQPLIPGKEEEPPLEPFKPIHGEDALTTEIRRLMWSSRIAEPLLIAFLRDRKAMKDDQKSFSELAEKKRLMIRDNWSVKNGMLDQLRVFEDKQKSPPEQS